MSKNRKKRRNGGVRSRRPAGRRDYRVSARGRLRREPDVRRLARAVIALAMAQAEADAAAEWEGTNEPAEAGDA